MFVGLRKRLCYANVTATFALVFAMSGGALAASHYLLTSTSQISPKVLKALKGKAGKTGPAGAPGVAGPQGPAGAQGSQGAKGETGPAGAAGAAGAVGAKGETGAPGAAGKEGSPWTAGGTLPSKKSETGTWAVSGVKETFVNSTALASFTIPLAEAPTVAVIGVGEGEGEEHANLPAGCKGNQGKPIAEPGNLCVFENAEINVADVRVNASAVGAIAHVEVESFENEFNVFGTWAVTAK